MVVAVVVVLALAVAVGVVVVIALAVAVGIVVVIALAVAVGVVMVVAVAAEVYPDSSLPAQRVLLTLRARAGVRGENHAPPRTLPGAALLGGAAPAAAAGLCLWREGGCPSRRLVLRERQVLVPVLQFGSYWTELHAHRVRSDSVRIGAAIGVRSDSDR